MSLMRKGVLIVGTKNTNQNTGQKAEELARKALDLLLSEPGRQALSRAIQQVVKETDRLKEARQVDPKTLHEPVTL